MNDEVDVNSFQVGGDHYKADVQHWDYVEKNGMGYLEGCATKYGIRNRKKHENPIMDLEKAVHYVLKLKDLHLNHGRFNRTPFVAGRARRLKITPPEFAGENNLNHDELELLGVLTFWRIADDLDKALAVLDRMIAKANSK